MSKIRAAIFDCYSTLIDIKTNEQKDDIFHYLALYLQYYGAKTAAGQLRADINLKREQHLKSKDEPYPEVDLEIIFREILKEKGLNSPLLAESCCKLFRLLSRERFQLFPDSLPVLEDMRKSKYPLAVVSDAQKVFCPEEGEILGIRQFFRFFILSTDFGFRKPDSRLFTIACTLLGILPSDIVYIGNDPETDVKGAKQVGMRAILLDRTLTNSNHESKPDFYATDLWQAWDWIKDNSYGPN
jgi:putative hydrolase of the HAD superfamily